MTSTKSKKLNSAKNVQKPKGHCWNRTKMILSVSFLVALLAISTLYLKSFAESAGWEAVLEQLEVEKYDDNKLKESSIAGTVWKNKGKIGEIGYVYLFHDKESGSKEIIFRLASTVDNIELDELSANEQKLKIIAAIDIDRNGNRLTSRQIDICVLDENHLEVCQAKPPNKIQIHKEVPLPRYLFSGNYHLSGKLELVAFNGTKWELGYAECDVKL